MPKIRISMFIKAHDMHDGKWTVINGDDISRVEEFNGGTVVYFKSVTDDFDGTRRQVHMYYKEDIEYFKWALDVTTMQYIDRSKE